MNQPQHERHSKRFSLNLRGQYRISENDFPYHVITALNISQYGICFKSDDLAQEGHTVELIVRLNDQEPELSLLGKVIWSTEMNTPDEYLTGIEIMNVNSDDAKKFSSFYAYQMEQHASE